MEFGTRLQCDECSISDAKLMVELRGILNTFMQFAGHFVWKHTS